MSDHGRSEVGWQSKDISDDAPVTVRLRDQLGRTPENTAIADGIRRLSYQQLHAGATAVAGRLQHEGVTPGDLVGVCMPRQMETLVAILGVLFAGAAYVPLDPRYPSNRLAEMCSTVDLKLMIGEPSDVNSFPNSAQHLDPGTIQADQRRRSAHRPPRPTLPRIDPSAPAYVLFTSGSTGPPKGVRVSHRGLTALIRWGRSAFSLEELQVVAACTSFSFDPSVFEIFVPLCAGGTVRILPSALALGELGADSPVTMALAAPSAISELVRSQRLPSTLHTLMTGGEPLPASLANRVLERTAVDRLIFAYGLTETTMTASAYDVVHPATDPVPIGWELPAVEILLLDADLVPVASGEVGQIYVAGPHVADGYVGDPDLTAERFVTAPGPSRWAVMYRTGDLGRRREDGALEFCGRSDRQVKVRGYRVEPTDVERALCRHPGVAQAFVATPDQDGTTLLVAYIVPLASEVSPEELRDHMRQIVPDHMVPSGFVSVPLFPVNQSGKVDPAALPRWRARAGAGPGGPEGGAGPRAQHGVRPLIQDHIDDQIEQAVLAVVREVLSLGGPLATTDDFMDDLGGTSLSAVRVLYELQDIFGIEIPLTAILADTRIGGFIRAVRSGATGAITQLHLNSGGTKTPLVLVHAWLGCVIRYRRLGPFLDPDRPLVGIHVHDQAMTEIPVDRVADMADRAIQQLRVIRPHGPYVIGGHSTGGFIAYEMARSLREAGEAVPLVILLDAPVPSRGWRFWWDEANWNLPSLRSMTIAEGGQRAKAFVVNRAPSWGSRGGDPVARARDTVARTNRSNYVAAKRYRPARYDGDVAILRTAQGTRLARGDELLGWAEMTTGAISNQLVAGSHDGMFDEHHLEDLARHIDLALGTSSVDRGQPLASERVHR